MDTERTELADAIAELDRAQRSLAKANDATERAAIRLRDAERAKVDAEESLQAAKDARIDALVASDGSEPPAADKAVKRAREAILAADDDVEAARSALELVRSQVAPITYSVSSARRRRDKAVSAVAAQAADRIKSETTDLTERLLAKRAELISLRALLDDYSHDGLRREINGYLARPLLDVEGGYRTDDNLERRDAALAAWGAFAREIVVNAAAEFPVLPDRPYEDPVATGTRR